LFPGAPARAEAGIDIAVSTATDKSDNKKILIFIFDLLVKFETASMSWLPPNGLRFTCAAQRSGAASGATSLDG